MIKARVRVRPRNSLKKLRNDFRKYCNEAEKRQEELREFMEQLIQSGVIKNRMPCTLSLPSGSADVILNLEPILNPRARHDSEWSSSTSTYHPHGNTKHPTTPLEIPQVPTAMLSEHSAGQVTPPRLALPEALANATRTSAISSRLSNSTASSDDSVSSAKLLQRPTQTIADKVSSTKSTSLHTSMQVKDKDPLDRRDFTHVRSMDDSVFRFVISIHADPAKVIPKNACRVIDRLEGSFHHVVIVEARLPSGICKDFVIKVPGHGSKATWRDEDSQMLEAEAELMKYLFANTKVPIPEVIAYKTGIFNELGAPFILMRRAPGMQAHKLWNEGKKHGDREYRVSPETDKKRINFLYSLAHSMAELQKLTFDGIGIPRFSQDDGDGGILKTTIGPAFHWHTKADFIEPILHPPFASTRDFVMSALNTAWPAEIEPEPDGDQDLDAIRGIRKVLEIIFVHPVFTMSKASPSDEKETFVLRHSDLNLQNIMVDDEGNVTSIIDWHLCSSVPRCIGLTAVPMFLRRDMYGGLSMDDTPATLWSLQKYREVYAKAMKAEMERMYGDTGDARYTRKSALYQAAIDGCHGENKLTDLVEKILRRVPGGLDVDAELIVQKIGREGGAPQLEEYLKEAICQILYPDE